MNINYKYSSNENNSIEEYAKMIQTYITYINVNKTAILDTAYYYGNTTTEQIIGKILSNLSVMPKIATKVNPWLNNDFTNGKLGQLSSKPLENQLKTSLYNLNLDSIEYMFLHCPDYETPIEETLETCEKLWRKEKFNKLGISNFSYDQMYAILHICEKNGYNAPDVYQGMYNLISRKVEEIIPLLHDNHIEFWAYNPLAGGLLTGKYRDYKNSSEITDNSRFKNNTIYQSIFWKPEIIENNKIQEFFQLGNEKCIEYSYKWLQKYSKMDHTTDRIVIGCSNVEQLSNTLDITQNERKHTSVEKEIVMKYFNKFLYQDIAQFSPNYWY
jgi:aflatoxin B1 aldehyde reductase